MMDFANVLGTFFKLLAGVVVGAFAVVLEFAFFTSISPTDKPWFPYLAMSLTAGGFLCWMLSFRLIKHHPLHTLIAFLMMIGCAGASLVVAGTEFYSWIAEHYSIATSPLMYQNVTTMLLVIFCAHVVALLVDVSFGHFAKNPFRGSGNLIPMSYAQNGNLIPMYPQYPYYQNALPQHAEGRGEPARPLSKRNQPKEAPANFDQEAEIPAAPPEQPKKQLPPMNLDEMDTYGDMGSAGVNMLTQRVRGFTSNIRTAHRARGKANETTNENT